MKIFTVKAFKSEKEIEEFFHKLFKSDCFEIIEIIYSSENDVNPYKVFFYIK